MRIDFVIPGTPKGKARPRSTARIVGDGPDARAIASVYADKESAALEIDIARLYRIAAGGRVISAGPIRIDILAVFPYGATTFPRAVMRAAEQARLLHIGRPDLDNIEKLVKDALNGIAWRDDGQVAIVTKRKRYGTPARVEVAVTHIEQADDERTPGQIALEKRVRAEGWDAVLAQEDKIGAKRRRRARRGPGR